MPIFISFHAARRFRSRYMRPDEREEIGDRVADEWLWGLIQLAVRAGAYEDVVDEDRPLRVIELAARSPGAQPLYACQRADGCVVSVLEWWQRDNNRVGRWTQPDGGPIAFGATLAERSSR